MVTAYLNISFSVRILAFFEKKKGEETCQLKYHFVKLVLQSVNEAELFFLSEIRQKVLREFRLFSSMIIFDVKLYFDINQDVKQLTELVDVKIFIWIHLLSRQLCSLSKREEGAYISDLFRVTSWRQNIP